MRVASEIGDALLGRVSENLPVSTRGDCPKGCRAIIPPNESIFDHMKLPHVIPPIVVPLSSTEDDEEDPLSGLSPDQSQSEGKNPFDAITCLLASRDVKCQEYHWILNQWWSSLDESQKALVIRREGRPD